MKLYTRPEVAQILRVSRDTLVMWEKSGRLIPAVVTDGKHRRYTEDQIAPFRKQNDQHLGLTVEVPRKELGDEDARSALRRRMRDAVYGLVGDTQTADKLLLKLIEVVESTLGDRGDLRDTLKSLTVRLSVEGE